MSTRTNSFVVSEGYVLSAERVVQWIMKRFPKLRELYQPTAQPDGTPIRPRRGATFFECDILKILRRDDCRALFDPLFFLKVDEKDEIGIFMLNGSVRQQNRTATDFNVLQEMPRNVKAKQYLLRELGIEDNDLKWATTCTLNEDAAHISLKWPEMIYHTTSGIGVCFAGVIADSVDDSDSPSTVHYAHDAGGMILALIMPNSKVPFYNGNIKLKLTTSSKWNGGLQGEFCRIKPDCNLTMDAVGPLSSDTRVPPTTFCLAVGQRFNAANLDNHPPSTLNMIVKTSLSSQGELLTHVEHSDEDGNTKACAFNHFSVSEYIRGERVELTVQITKS